MSLSRQLILILAAGFLIITGVRMGERGGVIVRRELREVGGGEQTTDSEPDFAQGSEWWKNKTWSADWCICSFSYSTEGLPEGLRFPDKLRIRCTVTLLL